MEQGWLIVLVVSAVLLVIVLLRTRPNVRWFGYALLQLVISAILLFVINGTGLFGDFYIPINLATVFTIAVLGVPGLGLLAAIKLTIL